MHAVGRVRHVGWCSSSFREKNGYIFYFGVYFYWTEKVGKTVRKILCPDTPRYQKDGNRFCGDKVLDWPSLKTLHICGLSHWILNLKYGGLVEKQTTFYFKQAVHCAVSTDALEAIMRSSQEGMCSFASHLKFVSGLLLSQKENNLFY